VAVARRRRGALLAAGLICTAGGAAAPSSHDPFLLAALVAAGGLFWTSRAWKARVLAGLMAMAGLAWSGLDTNGCSIGSRARLFSEKVAGHLPYIDWGDVRRQALCRPCHASPAGHKEFDSSIKKVTEKSVNGESMGLYQTPIGDFWIPGSDRALLSWVLWEITVQHCYESRQTVIRPGDTVIDAGAHVGVFTRFALTRQAGRVVAIEPDRTNIAALELNFGPEIASGRVILVKAGVWDRKTFLTFSHDENSARHSFVTKGENRELVDQVPVLPLDELVEQLRLDRVDFIKMDIEGAERRALAGARQVLGRFHPRMAISTYHLRDDTTAIPAVVRALEPGYRIHGKDAETGWDRYVTKVMFFDAR